MNKPAIRKNTIDDHLEVALNRLNAENKNVIAYSVNQRKQEASITFEENGNMLRQKLKLVGQGMVNTNTKFPQGLSGDALRNEFIKWLDLGFTQDELAEISGYTQGYISRLINNK